jgi:hypothetical protein
MPLLQGAFEQSQFREIQLTREYPMRRYSVEKEIHRVLTRQSQNFVQVTQMTRNMDTIRSDARHPEQKPLSCLRRSPGAGGIGLPGNTYPIFVFLGVYNR